MLFCLHLSLYNIFDLHLSLYNILDLHLSLFNILDSHLSLYNIPRMKFGAPIQGPIWTPQYHIALIFDGHQGTLKWGPRYASLSYGCTPDRCRISFFFIEIAVAAVKTSPGNPNILMHYFTDATRKENLIK